MITVYSDQLIDVLIAEMRRHKVKLKTLTGSTICQSINYGSKLNLSSNIIRIYLKPALYFL